MDNGHFPINLDGWMGSTAMVFVYIELMNLGILNS